MTSQTLRAACALTLLLSAHVWLGAAEPSPSPAQVETVRRQYFQALQKGDFAAADRYDNELKALEARLGAAGGSTSGATSGAPVPTFFSAPPGSAASAPAATSSVFAPPGVTATTIAPPTFPSAPKYSPAPKAVVPPPTLPSTPGNNSAFSTAPAAASSFTPVVDSRPTSSPFGLPAATPLPVEEPRPADLPPVVIELRAAQAELSKLEEFRMAESLTSRRSATMTFESPRAGSVSPPSAVMAPSSFSPAVSSGTTSGDPSRRLDDLSRRKSELQSEAEQLARGSSDWETRYAAAKAEVARLEAENKARERLQGIRAEVSRLDSDSARLMQDTEAGRVDQSRRAREALSLAGQPATVTAVVRDRPMATTSADSMSASSERKGPPQFLPVGTSRPATMMGGDGNIVRTGRSGGDVLALQRDLDRLDEKREIMLREIDEVQLKFNLAQREMATAGRTGVQSDIDRWTRETGALDSRYKAATAELARIDAERSAKISAMKGAVSGGDPDMVNPGDSVRLIVAEDDSYNAIYPVKRDGNITVKGVGRVPVAGKGIMEAEAAVKALLEETQLTKATVTLEFVGERRTTGGDPLPSTDQTVIIYLAGEFITPGPLKIPEGVAPTLITTIIRSGGITPSGDLTRAKLLRIENGQGAVEEVNVAAILSGNIPPTDIALNPGDIIMIPAFAPVVYVTGNVNKPGTLRLFQDETLTGYAAILRAGGFSRFANLKKCTVVRDLGNGEKVQMPLNVKEIQKGLAPDIVLQGKDIVVVPESFFSF